ncbi:tRNA synthetases class I (M)-domain-containing protein [Boletus edulis BED1]|uniref:methionine--tRNA ligase n=1 Tax=Boletus edulis BED1 TaxID=1328754 RepID=A0AAD4GG92_BOLED|nr:tRNA synthetases class I (M)-domain-containing protein [Boletus edulis BED1]
MFSCRGLRSRFRSSHVAFSRPVVLLVRRHSATQSTVKPFYVTTPIFYPNARPHIGHLQSLVTADIIARYQRILNPARPVVFLTGTDEHGLKMQQAAEAKGVDPLAWCDTLSAEFRTLSERANISATVFMRTTQRRHRDTVEHVWRTLADRGLIYKDTYEGYYSTTDECFYPSSRVTSHPTRSDTKIATETGSVVEWSSEVNYKLRLSQFREVLLAYYATTAERNANAEDGLVSRGIYPDVYQNAVVQDLNAGLEDLSISRPRERIGWGIPVPGDPSQTVYVWFDALLVYLSGVGYPSSGTTVWPPDVQVIGKDILRFHAIYLPEIVRAMDLEMPKTLLTHAHWTAGQKKMSKSLGNVADPIAAMDGYGVDAVRFYLARVGGRFRDDVDWSEDQLRKHADEIRNSLANYFLRVTSNVIKRRAARATTTSESLLYCDLFSRQFPNLDLSGALTSSLDLETCRLSTNEELLALLDDLGGRVSRSMRNFEVGDALQAIVLVLRHANALLTILEPWSDAHPPDVALSCYLTALETLRITGILLQPFIPHTSEKLLGALKVSVDERSVAHARVGKCQVGGGLIMDVRGVKLFDKPANKGTSDS